MRGTLRRVVISGWAIAVVLVSGPAAQACDNPVAHAGGIAAAGVGPGDPIRIVFTGTDAGASFSVLVDGRQAGGGSVPSNLRSSVPMPDLGGETRMVNVDVRIDHASAAQGHKNVRDRHSSFEEKYWAPAPPAAPASEPARPMTSLSGSTPSTTGSRTRRTREPRTTGTGGSASPPASPGGGGGSPSYAAPGAKTASPGGQRDRSAKPAKQGASRRTPTVLPQRIPEPTRAAETPGVVPAAGEEDDSSLTVPLAVLLAIVVLLGAAGAGVALLRRLPGDDDAPATGFILPAPAEVLEAELQQLIAAQQRWNADGAGEPAVEDPADATDADRALPEVGP